MNFDFTQVNKGKWGNAGLTFPDQTVRISARSITVASDIVSSYGPETKYKTEIGDDRMRLGFAFDVRNQAIQVVPAVSGFSYRIDENGKAIGGIPVNLRHAELPKGDYKAVQGQPNVYMLVR